jgi:hypothetical protein
VANEIPSCAVCAKPFTAQRMGQRVCSRYCAAKVPKIERKAEAQKTRAAKEAQKTLPQLRKEAQAVFNLFIRLRDFGKPCVCCGRLPFGPQALTGGQFDAGHYRSRGACPELAFDERNVHAQLKACNRFSQDVAGYRAELIKRIGLDQVEDLERHHAPKKYTRDDMRAIRDKYKAKARELASAAKIS